MNKAIVMMNPRRVGNVTRIIALLSIVLLASMAGAATLVATPTGSGNNSGIDWAHACAGFTGNCAWSALNRGDTLWFGGGATHYTGQGTQNTPESGANLITIQGATASSHGPATGWSNAFGVDVTPAIWDMNVFSSIAGNNFVTLRTGYWVINGAVASDPTNPATYGIQFAHPDCTHDYFSIFYGDGPGQTIDHVIIKYVAIDMSGCGTASFARRLQDGGAQGQRTNNTVSHWYCNGCQNGITIRNPPGTNSDSDIIEYGYSVNAFDDTTHHGTCVTMFGNVTNVSIRYNQCYNITGSGGILAEAGSGGVSGAIYGNVLASDNCVPTCNNGIIASTSDSSYANTNVYNNTFPNSAAGEPWWQGCIAGNPTQCAAATGNVLKNNIIYNQNCALVGGDTPTHDHNSYLFCLDTAPVETGGQVANFNPFVNSTTNFALAIDTSAWLSLSSPYNLDPTGATRTSSRGAYQFVNSLPAVPAANFIAQVAK